jgi:hypothetical protein
MPEQLLRAPALALPPGLTCLRAMHIQFSLDCPPDCGAPGAHHHARGGAARHDGSGGGSSSAAEAQTRALAGIFGSLADLDYSYGEHADADRLLDAALPHCAALQTLHISGPGALVGGRPREPPFSCLPAASCLHHQRARPQPLAPRPSTAPGAFYHTPLSSAFGYGVSYGLSASSLFLVPWATWLPALLGRAARLGGGGAAAGGTWLRHLAGLPALTEVHLDLPLTMPHQVRLRRASGAGAGCCWRLPASEHPASLWLRSNPAEPGPPFPHNPPARPQLCELVDALVARGALHSLAVHGLTISLVTHRDWVVRQLARLAPIGLQNVNISFGRHALAALPSWLRRGGGGANAAGGARRGGGAPPEPDPRDSRMLEQLAEVFRSAAEAHFVMHTGEYEESVHSQPWGLPVPEPVGGGAGPVGGGGAGPLGEGVEEPGAGAGPGGGGAFAFGGGGGPGVGPPEGEDAEAALPLRIRLLAHVLAVALGPREAVRLMAQQMAAANEGAPPQWQVGGAGYGRPERGPPPPPAGPQGPRPGTRPCERPPAPRLLPLSPSALPCLPAPPHTPQLQQLLMDVVAPHHDAERVELPQGVLGFSRAAAAFAVGAACAVGAVGVPLWGAAARAAWRAAGGGGGAGDA